MRGVTSLSEPLSPRPVVLVFARALDGGPVKTRLAAAIGDEDARAVYRALAEGVWAGLRHAALARHLWIAPAAATAQAAAWLRGAEEAHGQPEGGLGARLTTAFDAAFAGGAPWATAVGTDAPDVDAAMVLRAGALLETHEVTIVPALDGGYALIALRRPTPELFTEMPWSRPQLLAATLERAASLGLRVAQLPAVRDVDEVEDLASFPALRPRSGPSATRP